MPNSFKECADLVEITEFIKASLFRLLPDEIKTNIDFCLKPVSDGGDGFLQVCQRNFGIEFSTSKSEILLTMINFLPCRILPETKTLYIESAEVLVKNYSRRIQKTNDFIFERYG